MAVYKILVWISPASVGAQPMPDAAVARVCEALRVELQRTLPYVRVSVTPGSGPPEIYADRQEDVERAWHSIHAAHERVVRRLVGQERWPASSTDSAIASFDAVQDGRGRWIVSSIAYGQTSTG